MSNTNNYSITELNKIHNLNNCNKKLTYSINNIDNKIRLCEEQMYRLREYKDSMEKNFNAMIDAENARLSEELKVIDEVIICDYCKINK